MTQLENLLQQCTVQITIPGQSGWGTGFFVAPGLILTCAHVVKALAVGATARIRWQQQADFATAEIVQLESKLDLALLQFTSTNTDLPCVYLDEALQTGQELYFFGYPDQDFDNGCPVTGSCEGFTGDVPPLIKFKQAQVRPGMSGSALLNRRTGRVCGMVKFTRDRSIDLGGGAISTRVILEQFPHLREFQREFHQRDRRWHNLVTTQSEIDFQPYLESILNNEDYLEWQEVYTPTKVEDRKRLPPVTLAEPPQPRFSRRLKLRVETVKPLEPKGERSEPIERQEQVEQLDVLAGLRKYAPDHVLLIGKPGSGKSTSLERLLWEETDQVLKQAANAKIPVLVKLRRCTGTIEALIQVFCRGHQLPLTIAEIETLLDQGRLLLLLDGLNELPEAFRTTLANFRDRYRATIPMIVSTRELSIGGNLGIAKTLKMLPLSEPQMREFVQGYLGQEGNRLFQQIKGDRLGKFAETPLLLWMLCRVFAQNAHVPANLGLAFREFTQLYDADLQQDAPAASREQWSKLLRHLAFALMHDRAPTDLRLSMSREEATDRLTTCLQQEGRANARDDAECGLKDLLSYHLIQPVMQPNYEEHIEFRHQLIQEYYAAEYLLRILPTLSDEQLQREYLNYLKWTEPVALMLAMLEKEAQVLRVVKLAMGVDWWLGALLVGESKREFQEKAVEFITQLEVPNWLVVQLLGKAQRVEIVEILFEALEADDFEVFDNGVKALGELNSAQAVPELLKVLEELWKYGWTEGASFSMVQVLKKFGSEEVIPGLVKVLKHEQDYETFISAAEALEELDARQSIPDLLKILDDLPYWKFPRVLITLLKLGSEQAIHRLPEALGCENRDGGCYLVSFVIVELLESESVIAIPTLIKLLECQKPFIYLLDDLIANLRELDPEQVICGLLNALEHENPHVSWGASSLLWEIIYLDGSDARWRKIEVLEKLGSEPTILGLLQRLKHEDYLEYWMAHSLLRLLSSERVSSILLRSLEDENYYVRFGAACALGKVGSEQAASELLKALEHENFEFHESAVEALGGLRSEEAVLGLLKALKDESQVVQQRAIEALRKLASEGATPELKVLVDANIATYWREAKALRKLNLDQVICGFLKALGDEDIAAQRSAVEALEKWREPSRLLVILEGKSSYVCKRAIEALVEFGSYELTARFFKALGGERCHKSRRAVRALVELGSKQLITQLLRALDDEDLHVRWNAAKFLSALRSKQVPPELLRALDDKDFDVRLAAAEALSGLRSEQALPELLKVLEHESYGFREGAVEALGKLDSEQAISALLKAFEDESTRVRRKAADALEKMDTDKASFALPQLTRLILTQSGEEALRAIRGIQNRCKFYNYEIAHNLPPQGKSIALYFSSAPSDAELQTQLANHLNLLERQAIISSWHHRQILPGDERAQVINDRLNSADIILLLISADSISDHTCYDIEINRAMERHQAGEARAIPILLRPVDWQGAPFSQLPVLPRNRQPVTSWGDRDAAFQEIAEGIREVAIELRRTKGARA